MPTDLLAQIDETVSSFRAKVDDHLSAWLAARSASEFRAAELALAALGRALCDCIMAVLLHAVLSDPELQAKATASAQASGNYRSGGAREVTVTLLGGGSTRVHVPYLKPNRRGRPGPKRRRGKRGPGGAGIYPTLEALGIWTRVTPALAGEVCRQVAASESVRAGREALDRRGIDLGHKQTLNIVNKFGDRAVQQRQDWLEGVRDQGLSGGGPLAGQRVVIGTDGGRTRIRKRSRGRRRKNGHRGYRAPWQEPKVLVVYIIDAYGRPVKEFRPVYDATMGDCDALLDMLVGYLKALGVHEATELIVVGDGAKWIWARVAELVERVGIKPEKVREVLDWYHAVETVHTIAKIPSQSSLTAKARRKWLRRALKLLRAGRIEELVPHIRTLAVGRRAKKVNSHVGYFENNAGRMRYGTFRTDKIPLGSGAIESTVRRVVNLRLKSNAKFWYEENAELMLLLRSYLKAGRFDDLFDWSINTAAAWWCPTSSPLYGPANGQTPSKTEPSTTPRYARAA